MKITNVKAMAAKVLTVGLVAGAFALAAKAEAQVTFGVRFGHPVYVAPAPIYRPGYFYGPAYPFHHEYFAPRYDRFHRGWR